MATATRMTVQQQLLRDRIQANLLAKMLDDDQRFAIRVFVISERPADAHIFLVPMLPCMLGLASLTGDFAKNLWAPRDWRFTTGFTAVRLPRR